MKHRADYSPCALSIPNTNFLDHEWNFVYKMWIFYIAVFYFVYSHVHSNKTRLYLENMSTRVQVRHFELTKDMNYRNEI